MKRKVLFSALTFCALSALCVFLVITMAVRGDAATPQNQVSLSETETQTEPPTNTEVTPEASTPMESIDVSSNLTPETPENSSPDVSPKSKPEVSVEPEPKTLTSPQPEDQDSEALAVVQRFFDALDRQAWEEHASLYAEYDRDWQFAYYTNKMNQQSREGVFSMQRAVIEDIFPAPIDPGLYPELTAILEDGHFSDLQGYVVKVNFTLDQEERGFLNGINYHYLLTGYTGDRWYVVIHTLATTADYIPTSEKEEFAQYTWRQKSLIN